MGDADLSADTFALNFDSGAFMSSFVRSMVDAQDPKTFSLPDTVPHSRYGGQPADPSWSAALPQNLWVRYTVAGDLDLARTYWGPAVSYMSNLAAQLKAAGGMATWKPPYGDWYGAHGSAWPPYAYKSFKMKVWRCITHTKSFGRKGERHIHGKSRSAT